MAIGIFDGVHRGHRAILKKAVREAGRLDADPAALTFPSHPSRILGPGRPVPLLQTFEQRCADIRRCGIKRIFPLQFTKRLSKFSPSDFVGKVLFRHWNLRGVVVGKDFRFGHRRSGGIDDLCRLLAPRGAKVWAVDPVRIGGRVVQSTRIRKALTSGRLERAVEMLGHPVILTGEVEKGAGLGARIGTRTVNLNLHNEVLPKFGVYAGWILHGPRGAKRPVVMNVGVAPTVHRNRKVLLEAHVIDGRNVHIRPGDWRSVELVRYLRPERKFSSEAALRRAIQTDVGSAKRMVGTASRGSGS